MAKQIDLPVEQSLSSVTSLGKAIETFNMTKESTTQFFQTLASLEKVHENDAIKKIEKVLRSETSKDVSRLSGKMAEMRAISSVGKFSGVDRAYALASAQRDIVEVQRAMHIGVLDIHEGEKELKKLRRAYAKAETMALGLPEGFRVGQLGTMGGSKWESLNRAGRVAKGGGVIVGELVTKAGGAILSEIGGMASGLMGLAAA